MEIEKATKANHPVLLEVWEASVRATHDFLMESDLLALKPLILEQYFDAVDLMVARNDAGDIVGFCGVSDGTIEMLFISPHARGQGVGALLVAYAINTQAATKVDVNEQNEQAVGFYQHMGFSIIHRALTAGWAG